MDNKGAADSPKTAQYPRLSYPDLGQQWLQYIGKKKLSIQHVNKQYIPVPPEETVPINPCILSKLSGTLIAFILCSEDKIGGVEMENSLKKKEAAETMKVSAPTFRKFVEKHKEIVEGGYINMEKLDEIITRESMNRLSKKGK